MGNKLKNIAKRMIAMERDRAAAATATEKATVSPAECQGVGLPRYPAECQGVGLPRCAAAAAWARKCSMKVDDNKQQNLDILIKVNRIAAGTAIRWKRNVEKHAGQVEQDPSSSTHTKIQYSSRLIGCTRCGTQRETSHMQLRTRYGYLAIYCNVCKSQDVCSHNLCQCNVIWHQCCIHRVDPGTHASRRGPMQEKEAKSEEEQSRPKSSKRKAPISKIGVTKARKERMGKRKRKPNSHSIHHVKFVINKSKPNSEIHERIKKKVIMKAEFWRIRTEDNMTKFANMDVHGMRSHKKSDDKAKSEDDATQVPQVTRRSLNHILMEEAAKQQEARRFKGLHCSKGELTTCKIARSRKTNRGDYNDRYVQGIGGNMNLQTNAGERSALLRILNAK